MIVHEGCFVYQALQNLKLYATPDLEEEDDDDDDDDFEDEPSFFVNECVHIDAKLTLDDDSTTFLRLADHSGWVLERHQGAVSCTELALQHKLTVRYVDAPQAVRPHPLDDSSAVFPDEKTLYPEQLIYCDLSFVHPVSNIRFYRLQTHNGWVHDRHSEKEANVPGHWLLLDATSQIERGTFCYQARTTLHVREQPDCTNQSMGPRVLQVGDLCVADLRRASPVSESGNGPFLRLADGSGWLFEHKLGTPVLDAVPLELGTYVVTILNEPEGVALRGQPSSSDDVILPTVLEFGSMVECDVQVRDGLGTVFYRVAGTHQWLPSRNQHGGKALLSLVHERRTRKVVHAQDAWKPDFVRGIAALCALDETHYDPTLQTITLTHADGLTFKIFCPTRTVGCIQYGIIQEQRFETNCSVQHLHRLLQMDTAGFTAYLSDSRRDLSVAANEEAANRSSSAIEHDEQDLRQQLFQLDGHLKTMQTKRAMLVKQITELDDQREEVEMKDRERRELQQQRLRQRHLQTAPLKKGEKAELLSRTESSTSESSEATPASEMPPELFSDQVLSLESGISSMTPSVNDSGTLSSEGSREDDEDDSLDEEDTLDDDDDDLDEEESEFSEESPEFSARRGSPTHRKYYKCGECDRAFSGRYSRDIHCRKVHKLYCKECDHIFPSFRELEAHMEKYDHW